MSRRKHLTPQQEKFVNLLVYNAGRLTATECAVQSGYSKDRARSTASELQNSNYYPLVVQEINKLRKENNEKYRASLDTHMRDLADIKRRALEENSFSAAVQAEVARGKAAGLYHETKTIMHGKIDQLTPEEVRKELEDIANQLNPKIVEGKAEEIIELRKVKRNEEEKQS